MNIGRLLQLTKRQKFVVVVLLLSASLFLSGFVSGTELIILALFLSVCTIVFLYLILRKDVIGSFFAPLLVLPFLYTLAFTLFYSVLPERLISRIIVTAVYAFGIYSLFLTQNIFAVSSIRTINLLRSARIVSFIITIVVFFFLVNIAFSLRFPFFVTPMLVAVFTFLLNYQSLWVYSLDNSHHKDLILFSSLISLALFELSFILVMWPVTAAIYAIFLTGIFYMYAGLVHAWIDRRLFKGIMWEYIWVGLLSILILFVFSEWGL